MSWQYLKISKDMELLERETLERETDDLCRECGQGGDIFPCKILGVCQTIFVVCEKLVIMWSWLYMYPLYSDIIVVMQVIFIWY
jgi:hypothetical protein